MKLRVIERAYLGGRLVYEKPARWIGADETAAALAGENARATVAGEVDMIELEFPDLPEGDRYFRIGTNPDGMVLPFRVGGR